MNYYVLSYRLTEDYMERRQQFREIHLGMARESAERGELVMAGAVGDPPDGALFIFRYVDRSAAEDFARHDPYVLNGLVTNWEVKPWAVVIGGEQ
jgi:uncharacterized protein YciI